jgi:3-phenylpropionate/cinnamic acid dioxygenase small subunit
LTIDVESPTQQLGRPIKLREPVHGRRIGSSEPTYGEIQDFLIDEAALLEEQRLNDWLDLLTPDIFYWMPTRQTVMRKAGSGFDDTMGFFFETMASLKMRVSRITDFDNAHSEDPPSRTRRLVSNLKLFETNVVEEFAAETNLLLLRTRGDSPQPQLVSARRLDLILRTPAGPKLSQRLILVDQTVLGTPNLGVFL